MLKTTFLSLVWLGCIRVNKNKLVTDSNGRNSGVYNGKIDDKIASLLSSIKKMSFGASFFNSKASLAFIQLKKVLIKALILYYFNSEYYILIVLSYAISEVLC